MHRATRAPSPERTSLSGVWSGSFTSPHGPLPPTAFMVTLVEHGGRLSGASDEVRAYGSPVGQTLHATLDGRRGPGGVSFVKTYDGDYANYDLVVYEGLVNDDATAIEGRWTVPGVWSGGFVMVRQSLGRVRGRNRGALAGAR